MVLLAKVEVNPERSSGRPLPVWYLHGAGYNQEPKNNWIKLSLKSYHDSATYSNCTFKFRTIVFTRRGREWSLHVYLFSCSGTVVFLDVLFTGRQVHCWPVTIAWGIPGHWTTQQIARACIYCISVADPDPELRQGKGVAVFLLLLLLFTLPAFLPSNSSF